MSNASGYAFRRTGDELSAVRVEAAGSDRWRLQDTLEAPWPDSFTRRIARDGGQAAWLLPEDMVTSSQTPLPRLKRRELLRAVTGWVARQEGGAPDDWSVSWHTHALASGNNEAQQVAMAYAKTADIAEEAAAAEAAGLAPGVMLPPSLLIDQFFRVSAAECRSQSVWNLVFVGGAGNVLVVASQEGLLLTRPLPGHVAGDEDEYLDRLVTEVDRSVFFARQTAGSPTVDGVYITGDDTLAAALAARLTENLEVPCSHWRLDSVVDCGDRVLSADEQLLTMAAVVAASSPRFNLAPNSRRGFLSPVARHRIMVGAVAAGVAVIPLLIAGGLITRQVQDGYLDNAEKNLARATIRAERAAEVYDLQRQLNAREEFLSQHQTTRYDLEGIMRRLAVSAPSSVRFRELNLTHRDDGLVLQLTATSSGRTVSAAQEAFMTFQSAVVGLDDVVPLGEPQTLQIGETDDEGRISQNVLFTMECRLMLAAAGEEG